MIKKQAEKEYSYLKRGPSGKRMGRDGFSLIEILIVLVVLAIIVDGVTMIMGKNSDRAKFVAAQKDLDLIQQAFMRYYSQTGSFAGVQEEGTLDNCFRESHQGHQRISIFQQVFNKPLSSFKTPWNTDYMIRAKIDESSGTGTIIAFIPEVKGFPMTRPNPIGGIALGDILVDTVSSKDGSEIPMYRIIFNTNY